MLTQYQIALKPERPAAVRPEWAYRLYAALLEEIPREIGTSLHRDEVTPIGQFLQVLQDGTLRWTVSLLGDEMEQALVPVLEAKSRYYLHKDGIIVTVSSREKRQIADVDALLDAAMHSSGEHCLVFHTATAFKSQGQYVNLPTQRLIVQSLVKKWNGCFPDCPIEDEDGQGVDALAAGLKCRTFQLTNRTFFLKGNAIPGFVGTLTLENRLSGFQRKLADALLLFADYAGIGIKTTLGMGGVRHHS